MTNQQQITDLRWDLKHRRGSEIQAGARALLAPSPVHAALSTSSGRMTARMMIRMAGFPAANNFAANRIRLMLEATIASIPVDRDDPLTVDVPSGFSALGYDIARHYPNGHHIDVGSMDTIAELQRRFAKGTGYDMPPNYLFETVSPRVLDLSTVIDGQADVILTNNAYFDRADSVQMLAYLRTLLKDEGSVVTMFPHEPSLALAPATVRFFRSQIGQYAISVHDEDEIHDIFRDAGYRTSEVWFADQLPHLNLPQPIAPLELVAIGHR